ncbi:MAG: 23S rRNA (uracil(1939)-C(5))-methyltransferase RlmD, partial [Oscillospiraceae bacterium]|nr:23S rRNA (uracil(1939)-C(5))-methyltransferase RlmD [Oscillospiraceae bacterium]
MQKNEIVTLRITGTTSDGLGVGHAEGRSVFLSGAMEGELWKAGITKVSANAVYARRIELLEASPHRQEPDCPYFGRCGGCDFRHMDYQEELRIKANRVRDALRRIGGLDVDQVPILGAENPDYYRNKS